MFLCSSQGFVHVSPFRIPKFETGSTAPLGRGVWEWVGDHAFRANLGTHPGGE